VTNCEGASGELFEQNRKRFLKEAQSLAKLSDIPEVVKVMGFFPENGTAYIIMEYVQGVTLKEHVRRRGNLDETEARAIFCPVIEGLQKVHQAGLVHRDLSPDNIMLLPENRVKLLDFGAVRSYGNQAQSQSTQAILKPGFAPLEQYKSRGDLGPWTDVYALCATIYYCMSGKLPPDAPERMLEGTEPDWSLARGLTRYQIEALRRGMALRREDRIPSAGQLREQMNWGRQDYFRQQPQQTPYTAPVQNIPKTAPVERPSATRPVQEQYVPKTAPVERPSVTIPVQDRYVPKTAPVERPTAAKPNRPQEPIREMPRIPQTPVKPKKKKNRALPICVALLGLGVAVFLWAVISGQNPPDYDGHLPVMSGRRGEESVTAVMLNDRAISSTELNYYFIDTANYLMETTFPYYIELGMLDPNTPLDEQENPLTGDVWSSIVLGQALDEIELNYSLLDDAQKNGYTPPAEIQAKVDQELQQLEIYAEMYGYDSSEKYLQAIYGNTASVQSYEEYLRHRYQARQYYENYTFDESYVASVRSDVETNHGSWFNSYSYSYYYVNGAAFQDDAAGTAEQKLTNIVQQIFGQYFTNAEQLDAAIAKAGILDGSVTTPKSTLYTNILGSEIEQEEVRLWLEAGGQYAGQKACLPCCDENGAVTGYGIILLHGFTDNRTPMKNARHILFSASNYDDSRAAAEEILRQLQSTPFTEQDFAALADTVSDDESTPGGLYTEIYPGQMVQSFDQWCYDRSRKPGDVGIVESEYGAHIIYFVGNCDITYRDRLVNAHVDQVSRNAFVEALLESHTLSLVDLGYVNSSIVIGG